MKVKFEKIDSSDIDLLQKTNRESAITALRQLRERECFGLVNRGQVWYESLTDNQKQELKVWYKKWLDVTETFVVPTKPYWLK